MPTTWTVVEWQTLITEVRSGMFVHELIATVRRASAEAI
jgi:hypothetical protein